MSRARKLAIKRIRANDRVTWVETIDLSHTTPARQWQAIGQGVGGLEWHLSEIEEQTRPFALGRRSRPAAYSNAWYAREILDAISLARSLAHVSPTHPAAAPTFLALADTALRIGRLYGEMRIRRAFNPAVQAVRMTKAKAMKAGRRRGRDVRAEASERDAKIAAIATSIRKDTPYARLADHSTRWLAHTIAERLREPFGTIYGRLSALGIK